MPAFLWEPTIAYRTARAGADTLRARQRTGPPWRQVDHPCNLATVAFTRHAHAIRRGIPDISQRMLTLTLRNLERDGLVARHYYAELPPRVEYELTQRGYSMLKPLAGFTDWIRDTWQEIEASRRAFDEAEHERTANQQEGDQNRLR